MILRAFLFAFTRDHDVIDDGIGCSIRKIGSPIADESIKTAVSLPDSDGTRTSHQVRYTVL